MLIVFSCLAGLTCRQIFYLAGFHGRTVAPSGREVFYRNDHEMMAVSVQMEPTFKADMSWLLFEGTYAYGRLSTDYDIGEYRGHVQ